MTGFEKMHEYFVYTETFNNFYELYAQNTLQHFKVGASTSLPMSAGVYGHD